MDIGEMNLLQKALSDDFMLQGWAKVRGNAGAAGVDGVTVQHFAQSALSHINSLRAAVLAGTYQPAPLRRVELPRPGKSPRLLAIPAVADRVLQSACALALTPVLDARFEDESFAYRPGGSVRQAIARVVQWRDTGLAFAVDADIEDFFSHIPHARLLVRLAEQSGDISLLPLVEAWLLAPIHTPQGVIQPQAGVPQGSPISPLLANLYLDDFDETISAQGHRLVRYADDFLILCRDEAAADNALALPASRVPSLKGRARNRAPSLPFKGRARVGMGFVCPAAHFLA